MIELDIIFWIIIFIGGYLIIFFFADIFLNNLKLLCIVYEVSPLIIGILILGIDPEETIASIFASINGLPYVAIGNVIGNSIIALTLCFSLPALFYRIKFKSIPKFYFILIYSCIISILFSFLISSGLLIFGIINLSMYLVYLIKNFRNISSKEGTDLSLENEIIEEDESEDIEQVSKTKIIFLIIISFLLILLGGELLIYATNELIILTGISESIFGFIVIAFTTNVGELTLIIKSIKKQSIEIGMGGMIGKLIWNLTLTFGVSGIIASEIIFDWNLIWNWSSLLVIIFIFNLISLKKSLNRKDGIILACIFVVFILINLILPINPNKNLLALLNF